MIYGGKEYIPRLVLIDGANFMHCFRFIADGYCNASESRPSAFHLVALVNNLASMGHIVRIVVTKASMQAIRVHMFYILHELDKAGLIIHPEQSERKDKDDVLLLQLAEKWNAIVISNDQYRNYPGFRHVIENQVVKCEREFKNENSCLEMQGIFTEYFICNDNLIVTSDHSDYEKVRKSHEYYGKLSQKHIERLNILELYLKCDWFSKIGGKMPLECSFLESHRPFPVEFFMFAKKADSVEGRRIRKQHPTSLLVLSSSAMKKPVDGGGDY